ncbi:MarR family winged helix-turn-helix transcriptional regulator [Sulfurimonas sp. HSL-3221]|uniref:MarR family winged helix-turn-helix transcriptional regulator n=1 Tax=Sulfurimonadaceae TaxID=2771471 RepID=UPI001E5BF5DB|nr:MarR family winged helix-turn-helix transcriptional regulator [Sulfurimonas sp. HSL-3221]UFS62575.1 MarR family winged helix-turn-helix transcriptional regulator [Sulfurimonas sp. HSL-3221]
MKRTPQYGTLEDAVLRAHIELSRAFNKLRAKETATIADQGMTMAQFAILEALYHLGTLRIGQITELILSTPGNITVVIKNLESKGWIRVYPSETDRRIRMVEITETGQSLIAAHFPEHVRNLAAWYGAALETEELHTLSRLLRKLEKAQ